MQKQQTKFEQLQAQLEATMQDKVCPHRCRHCVLYLCACVGVGGACGWVGVGECVGVWGCMHAFSCITVSTCMCWIEHTTSMSCVVSVCVYTYVQYADIRKMSL